MSATIVSIQPFALKAERPGLSPGEFYLPPATPENPQFLVVNRGQIRMLDQDFRPFLVDEDPMRIAEDVSNTHCSSLIGYGPESMAGVFAVPGEVTSREQLLKEFKATFDKAVERQINFFRVLIGQADDDWRRNKQLKQIGDIHRQAARYLNLDREWLLDEIDSTMKCPSCMSTVNKLAAVCFACRAVLNEEKYNGLRFHNDSQNVAGVGRGQPQRQEAK